MASDEATKAWREWRNPVPGAVESDEQVLEREAFTAGYLAAQRAAVGEREHLEEAARHRYNRMLRNPNGVWSVESKAWLAREIRRRQTLTPKEDTHGEKVLTDPITKTLDELDRANEELARATSLLASVHFAIGGQASHGPEENARRTQEWIASAKERFAEDKFELELARAVCEAAEQLVLDSPRFGDRHPLTTALDKWRESRSRG